MQSTETANTIERELGIIKFMYVCTHHLKLSLPSLKQEKPVGQDYQVHGKSSSQNPLRLRF